jgi:probable HAF family extracellular repeat protein
MPLRLVNSQGDASREANHVGRGIMKNPRGLFGILTLLLCAWSLPALAARGYRVVPIAENGTTGIGINDLNRRGEVVGVRTVAGTTRAFRWRAGRFTDLHDTIDPASSLTEARGINDRSAVVAANWTNDEYHGILIRGSRVSPISVVANEHRVYPLDINNRGQILVESAGGAQSGSFLIDGDNVQWLGGPPAQPDSMNAIALNDRGAVLGNSWEIEGSHAALWQYGVTLDLGVVAGGAFSFGYDVNNHNHVVGIADVDGASQAMHWRDGTMSLLPQLRPNPSASSAESINDWGVIVGLTVFEDPDTQVDWNTATLWWGDQAVELDSLIGADDPLKPFVHLTSALEINNRGDIVAAGTDARTPGQRTIYFLTLWND